MAGVKTSCAKTSSAKRDDPTTCAQTAAVAKTPLEASVETTSDVDWIAASLSCEATMQGHCDFPSAQKAQLICASMGKTRLMTHAASRMKACARKTAAIAKPRDWSPSEARYCAKPRNRTSGCNSMP